MAPPRPSRRLRDLLAAGEVRLEACGIERPRLEAEVLMAQALGVDRGRLAMMLAATHAASAGGPVVPVPAAVAFRRMVRRRALREPLAYILGRREFWSLDFVVTPAVLTPRPETELLVESALKLLAAKSSPRILDLGTGSGAIAVALAKEIPSAEIVATDISREALEVACANARRHGLEQRISFRAGDLFDAVGPIAFDAIVSNPPYIREADIATLPRDVRDFEPLIALDGGADGLDFYRRIAREAPGYLNPGGSVAVEIGADMGEDVARLFAEAGFDGIRIEKDLAGLERAVSARVGI